MDRDVVFGEIHHIHNSSDDARNSSEDSMNTDEGSLDALMRDYDGYGTTPPRTRIHHKQMKKKISICKISKSLRRRSPAVSDHHADSEEDGLESRKKSDKRSIHLLRNSERTLKLNVHEMRESKEEQITNLSTYKVESSSRFLSLNCKLVKAAKKLKSSESDPTRSRADFHHFLENLVKAGNNESKNFKTQTSQEEQLWQTELKDLIWLELQARLADRTVTSQDRYLCEARGAVPRLLQDILTYRFEKKQDKLSTQSVDSGVFLPPSEDMADLCSGCLGLFCPSCLEHEALALREVGHLMSRLEAAEALFPSSKSFGSLFPVYTSQEFRSRVKAMCLWYNISRQLRLKTLIIGKQLMFYSQGTDVNQSIKSSESVKTTPDRTDEWDFSDPGCCRPLRDLEKVFMKIEDSDVSPYRKFIEDVLKTKGLKKSFQFMEQLHLQLLRKARIALEKPTEANKGNYSSTEECGLRRYGTWSPEYSSLALPSFRPAFLFMSRMPFEIIHEFLRLRLETRLGRPSSLSIRQLMKELKEGLKLAVIVKERYLYHCEVALAPDHTGAGREEGYRDGFLGPIDDFDQTVHEIIKLYLSYLEQWVALVQFGKLQKNILEEEWKFISQTSPHFPSSEDLSLPVFCKISCSVLTIICELIETKIETLLDDFVNEADEENIPPSATPTSSHNLPHRRMLQICRGLQALFIETRERTVHIVTLMKVLVKHYQGQGAAAAAAVGSGSTDPLVDLRGEALNLCDVMKTKILLVEGVVLRQQSLDEGSENFALQTRIREVIHQLYRYTFEYYKEIGRIGWLERQYILDMFQLSIGWLRFVKGYCERGRGVRPRWASFAIEFILYISNTKFTSLLSDKEFLDFREEIEGGVDYIKGCAPDREGGNNSSTPGYYRHSLSYPEPVSGSVPVTRLSNEDKVDSSHVNYETRECRADRLLAAVRQTDERLEARLREEELIGTVLSSQSGSLTSYDKKFIRPRSVTFVWQRGIKIGQGRFGKVYTAVNNDTGELMAMKEISLAPGDARAIQNVATELKIFEGISHENLVRYYGAEIHREELLIFMELCPEGTLEGLIVASESGLPESIVRRYSKQLTNAISTLHEHSIVHRDIKPANIFLTSEGNKLKLGDFGSAVKIRAQSTAPGELKGFVGTQAYMAPEVFMRTNTVGHGRAADIWSLGCVVIEMASGKRPWSEYDSNYQIMFKVGMGESPESPQSLSDEGQGFIASCIQHNVKRRPTIAELSQHNFLKVECEEEGPLCTMPSELEEYLKLGIKR